MAKAALKAVDDKFGSPTYTMDISEGMAELIETRAYGLYHMVNTGDPASRFEVAKAILLSAGIESCDVVPVSSAEFPLPAARPRMEAGRNCQLALRGWKWMRPWQEALDAYVKQLEAG